MSEDLLTIQPMSAGGPGGRMDHDIPSRPSGRYACNLPGGSADAGRRLVEQHANWLGARRLLPRKLNHCRRRSAARRQRGAMQGLANSPSQRRLLGTVRQLRGLDRAEDLNQ